MDKIGILIVDNDEASQSAVWQLLDSEGWDVKTAPTEKEAMHELASGQWTLVVANVGMIGLSGTLYTTLRELARLPPGASGKSRLRILFLVPEADGMEARPLFESEQLAYVLKPFHLHDFLEKVSDLLMETDAITEPIRRVRLEWNAAGRRNTRTVARYGAGTQQPARNQGMFANREDYGMTEEELTQYEAQEAEEKQRKKKEKDGTLAK